jgi:hypothetical protein
MKKQGTRRGGTSRITGPVGTIVIIIIKMTGTNTSTSSSRRHETGFIDRHVKVGCHGRRSRRRHRSCRRGGRTMTTCTRAAARDAARSTTSTCTSSHDDCGPSSRWRSWTMNTTGNGMGRVQKGCLQMLMVRMALGGTLAMPATAAAGTLVFAAAAASFGHVRR